MRRLANYIRAACARRNALNGSLFQAKSPLVGADGVSVIRSSNFFTRLQPEEGVLSLALAGRHFAYVPVALAIREYRLMAYGSARSPSTVRNEQDERVGTSRMSGLVSWAAGEVGSKLVSAEQALAAIRPGSRIFLGTGCAAPRKLLATLEAMSPGPADLEFVSFVTTSALPEGGGASTTRYRHRTFFVGSDVRRPAPSGSSTTCRSASRRCRNYWRPADCRSMLPCSRSRRPTLAASSASASPSTSRLRCSPSRGR